MRFGEAQETQNAPTPIKELLKKYPNGKYCVYIYGETLHAHHLPKYYQELLHAAVISGQNSMFRFYDRYFTSFPTYCHGFLREHKGFESKFLIYQQHIMTIIFP